MTMRSCPELDSVYELTLLPREFIEPRLITTVKTPLGDYPIYAFIIGSKVKTDPTLGLFAGVHGLEKIGTNVAVSFIKYLVTQLSWDKFHRHRFEHCRIVTIPCLNPLGMVLGRRSNFNGIDLMRNAPIDSTEANVMLASGHRVSRYLPWYRGVEGVAMEQEAQALVNFVRNEVFPARLALSLDLHSGYGMRDSLWYPYAKTKAPFPNTSQAEQLTSLLCETLPYHKYKVGPQSEDYITHGDLWDYLFDLHHATYSDRTYIPWTLEMATWQWLLRNPLQIFNANALFNPLQKHRFDRVMRSHLLLFNLFVSALLNPDSWAYAPEK